MRRVDCPRSTTIVFRLYSLRLAVFLLKRYTLLRTLADVATRRCGLRLRVPPVPKQLGLREYRKINVVRLPARQSYYSTFGAKLSNQGALREQVRPARPTRSPRISRLFRLDKKLRLVSHASAKVSGCVQRFQRRYLRVRPLVRRSALAPSAKDGSFALGFCGQLAPL